MASLIPGSKPLRNPFAPGGPYNPVKKKKKAPRRKPVMPLRADPRRREGVEGHPAKPIGTTKPAKKTIHPIDPITQPDPTFGLGAGPPTAPPVFAPAPSGVAPTTTPAPDSSPGRNLSDPATEFLRKQRTNTGLLHNQNQKDMLDFQNWLSQQSDTAEQFMQNRFADSQQQYQTALTGALQTAQKLNDQNMGMTQGVVTPETELATKLGAIQSQNVQTNTAENQNARNAAASLMTNARQVSGARVKDLRGLELAMHNKRLSELDRNDLENIYKQQQLGIDRATAEALGAKNLNEYQLDVYKAETDRQQVLSQAQYNAEKLRIDRLYNAGQLTLREKELELTRIKNQAATGVKTEDKRGAMQRGARKLAQSIRSQWTKDMGVPFNAKVPKDRQARLMQSVVLAIKNDYPEITGAQIRRIITAEFGAGMLSDPQIRNALMAALSSQGVSLS